MEWSTEAMAAKLSELKAVNAAQAAPAVQAAAAATVAAPAAAPAAAAAAGAGAAAPKAAFKPAIDIDKPRYPQTNFIGRMRRSLDIIDPLTLLTTDAELKKAQDTLAAYKSGALTVTADGKAATATSIPERELWAAKKVRDAIIHPDTQQKVPLVFRMSAFVPVNIPIVVGMISSSSMPAQVFWQWFNQSYNVAVNYANRNASSVMPTQQIAMSYAGAVATSCSLAIGFNKLIGRSDRWSPVARTLVRSLGPYTAVASAGALNVILMRRNEARDGIQVRSKVDGSVVGVSQAAGRKGLEQVALSRVFLPLPVLAMPALVMSGLEGVWPAIKTNRRLRMPIEVGVVAASLWAGLPAAIGLFPQECEMSVKELEPRFHNLKDNNGQPLTVFFNKGL